MHATGYKYLKCYRECYIYITLRFIPFIEKKLGPTGLDILRRVFGVILLAIAIKLFSANFYPAEYLLFCESLAEVLEIIDIRARFWLCPLLISPDFLSLESYIQNFLSQ